MIGGQDAQQYLMSYYSVYLEGDLEGESEEVFFIFLHEKH
jgi:hypothetical protein